MGWLQILEHLRNYDGRHRETHDDADGKGHRDLWDLLQEIGDQKKAAHAKRMFPEGGPTMGNTQCIRSASFV